MVAYFSFIAIHTRFSKTTNIFINNLLTRD